MRRGGGLSLASTVLHTSISLQIRILRGQGRGSRGGRHASPWLSRTSTAGRWSAKPIRKQVHSQRQELGKQLHKAASELWPREGSTEQAAQQNGMAGARAAQNRGQQQRLQQL